MNYMMIDLKTLGVPIFEIELTMFNLPDISSKRIDVDIIDVMWRTGFCPQPGTLEWWRRQNYNPSLVGDRVSLFDALSETVRIFEEFKPEFVWVNSPTFILEQHFNAVGMKKPWTNHAVASSL